MHTDVDSLKEQAENLSACLLRLRESIDTFPDPKEALWLETMLVSSLMALKNHIQQLESIGYSTGNMKNILWKR